MDKRCSDERLTVKNVMSFGIELNGFHFILSNF
jgi:hypothetical protein